MDLEGERERGKKAEADAHMKGGSGKGWSGDRMNCTHLGNGERVRLNIEESIT